MQTPYEQLLSVIPDHPAQRIMHFVDAPTSLVDALAAFTLAHNYEYLLLCFDAASAQKLTRHWALSPHITVKHVANYQTRFHTQAKMYDNVFIEAAIPDKALFLQHLYSSMKNAAVLFVLTTGGHEEIEQWRVGTEANFYVAFNTFELTEAIRIVSAKKMHGWGG